MDNQLTTVQAEKLTVFDGNKAMALHQPQPGYDSNEVKSRLSAVLQTTLELSALIHLFDKEVGPLLGYDNLHYHHNEADCTVQLGAASHHRCHYRLEMNGLWLGEFSLTRRKKFSDAEITLVEDLLCKLVYPLRNCLMYRQAITSALQDKLTGLNNRAAFDDCLQREFDVAKRQQTPLSLLVLDIDHFKKINDTYGHSNGDRALKALADCIKATMRGSDLAFRYGGEEFTLILNNTNIEAAHLVAERIRVAATQLTCNGDNNRRFGFTVSLGVTEFANTDDSGSLFDRADKALYQAKESGRNQVVCN